MCLGEICEVVELRDDGRAVVRGDQREQVALLMTLSDDVTPGDWVVVHAGFALERLTPEQAADARSIRATTEED